MQHKVLKYEQTNNIFCMGTKVNDRTKKTISKFSDSSKRAKWRGMWNELIDSNYYFYSW